MSKIFLPASITVLAVAIIIASFTSSGFIKGESKKVEVKGEAILVTKTPIPTTTPTPTPTLKIKPTVYKQPYIEPTDTPMPTPTIILLQPTSQPAYSNFQDKEAYCRNLAAEVVQKIANDPEMRADLQYIQGEVGSDVTKYLNDSTYTNAYQICLSKI